MSHQKLREPTNLRVRNTNAKGLSARRLGPCLSMKLSFLMLSALKLYLRMIKMGRNTDKPHKANTKWFDLKENPQRGLSLTLLKC